MLKTSSHYVTVLLDLAKRLGLDVDQLMVEAKISKSLLCSENLWLANDSLAVIIKALWRESSDECMGIDPQPTRMGTWALVCDYMLSAETLGELYQGGNK